MTIYFILLGLIFMNHNVYPNENISTTENSDFDTSKTSISEDDFVEALKDIAYYLRAHKFNEYDRRYETDYEKAERRYFKEFPRPPLRSLHWEVHKFCEPSFRECVEYLKRRIKLTASRRVDDTAVVMQEQKWTFPNNSAQINQIDEECKKQRRKDDTLADPFEGPLERFQWRATASYYMCWYTMSKISDMEHLSESCDNFANCLDTNLGSNNHDKRADDSKTFSCAAYSFCPDPCCPFKHLTRMETCWNSPDNPCFRGNPDGQRECSFNLSRNTEFSNIVWNRWNVTCRCPKPGYEWNSRYGICIDVNECTSKTHNCREESEACVNLPGGFRCVCRWGYIWIEKEKKCLPSAILSLLKLGRKTENVTNKSETLLKKIRKFFKRNSGTTINNQAVKIIYLFLIEMLVKFQ
nr:uncharacterized protein LOC111502717 isoform X1 [Leptinotarsa decemlineata]